MKKLSFEHKIKIKNLLPLLFWYWNDFYSFFASILECSIQELEYKYPKTTLTKYVVAQQLLDILTEEQLKRLLSEIYNLTEPFW